MRRLQCQTIPVDRQALGRTSLLTLAHRIIESGDRDALREIHENRPLFTYGREDHLLMSPFLLRCKASDLARRWCGQDPVVIEQAYDLTLAKFHDVPPDARGSRSMDRSDGPDCRHYYRAFYDYTAKEFSLRPPAGTIDAEVRAAEAFQQLVVRHFYLSCLEAKRRAMKLVRRYAWKVNGDQLVLWLPVEMSGRHCRRWLQENVPDPDPARPGERDRVQTIVDRLLVRRRILSLDQLREEDVGPSVHAAETPTLAEEISSVGLADVVAEEKAESIDDLRPAIRGLGRAALKELIRAVFESLADDRYHAERIAARFGVSKATLSRFAGCQWRRNDGDTARETEIPDLWRNTAHILANDEDFVAVARQAGVWDRVRQIVAANGCKGEAR